MRTHIMNKNKRPAHARTLLMCIFLISGMAIPAALYGADYTLSDGITVDSIVDERDKDPGDGSCETIGGMCTVRAAVQEANANPGEDTINIPPGIYLLNIPGVTENIAMSGDLDITESLTISGEGAATTVIDGGGADRVFHILDPGTIGKLQFSSEIVSASEDAGTVTVTVIRSGGSAGIVTVDYITTDGTAVAGTDYIANSGTLVFGDGETEKTFDITVIDDYASGIDRSFSITLNNPALGAVLGHKKTAVFSIIDDDSPEPGALQFGMAAFSISETAGSATITVTRTGGTNGAVTVDYAASNGTAQSGEDYEAVSGTLSFADGETLKSFDIAIMADSVADSGETILLALSNPGGGASLGAADNATLTIQEKEEPAVTISVLLSGLSIMNGSVVDESGGGLFVTGSESCSGKGGGSGGGHGGGGEMDDPAGSQHDGHGEEEEGGIYLAIEDCIIAGNTASGGGEVDAEGEPVVGLGAGIYSGSIMVITRSVIDSNAATGNGGGIYTSAQMSISDSTISNNSAGGGGGLFASGKHTSSITNSTFSGNIATGGGAISSRRQVLLDIINSTISGNHATDMGGGITSNGSFNLTNCTVAFNTADSDAGFGGAGINAFACMGSNSAGRFIITNTIFAGNMVGDRLANCGCTGGMCNIGNEMVSMGYNLEDADTCGFGRSTDHPNSDPLLGPLQDNGGFVLTHALLGGSPAIDAGDDSYCPAVDQRGAERGGDGNGDGIAVCDIGAYEAEDYPLSDLVMVSVSNPPDVKKRGGKFVIRDAIRNDGDSMSGRSVTYYYLSKDKRPSNNDIRLKNSRSVSSLDAGESSDKNGKPRRVIIPSRMRPGQYYLIACTDGRNNVIESDETNNCRASRKKIKIIR